MFFFPPRSLFLTPFLLLFPSIFSHRSLFLTSFLSYSLLSPPSLFFVLLQLLPLFLPLLLALIAMHNRRIQSLNKITCFCDIQGVATLEQQNTTEEKTKLLMTRGVLRKLLPNLHSSVYIIQTCGWWRWWCGVQSRFSFFFFVVVVDDTPFFFPFLCFSFSFYFFFLFSCLYSYIRIKWIEPVRPTNCFLLQYS